MSRQPGSARPPFLPSFLPAAPFFSLKTKSFKEHVGSTLFLWNSLKRLPVWPHALDLILPKCPKKRFLIQVCVLSKYQSWGSHVLDGLDIFGKYPSHNLMSPPGPQREWIEISKSPDRWRVKPQRNWFMCWVCVCNGQGKIKTIGPPSRWCFSQDLAMVQRQSFGLLFGGG